MAMSVLSKLLNSLQHTKCTMLNVLGQKVQVHTRLAQAHARKHTKANIFDLWCCLSSKQC